MGTHLGQGAPCPGMMEAKPCPGLGANSTCGCTYYVPSVAVWSYNLQSTGARASVSGRNLDSVPSTDINVSKQL